jgi:hypothetical protein
MFTSELWVFFQAKCPNYCTICYSYYPYLCVCVVTSRVFEYWVPNLTSSISPVVFYCTVLDSVVTVGMHMSMTAEMTVLLHPLLSGDHLH